MATSLDEFPARMRKTYSDYKQDTSYIVNWLVETASSNGYFNRNPAQGKGKGKGKAPQPAATSSASTGPTMSSQYKVSSLELKRLATFIRGKEAVVTHTFKNALDRAIKSRVWFREQFLLYFPVNGNTSTDGHDHFVKTLREIQGTLRSLMPKGNAESEASNLQGLPNSFAHLAVQELSETGPDAMLAETPIGTQAERLNYTSDLSFSPADVLMEFVLLVDSMNDMREYIRSIWERYTNGAADLAAAAVATNTAHELVQQMITDFQTKVKVEVNYDDLTRRCYRLFTNGRTSLDPDRYDCADDDFPASEDSYFWTNLLVNILLKAQGPGKKFVQPSAISGFRELKRLITHTADSFSASEAIDYFSVIFGNLIAIMGNNEGGIYDETIRRMRDVTDNGGSSFDLAFAAQVFLDIAYATYDFPDAPRQELLQHLNTLHSSFNSLQKSHEKVRTQVFKEKELEQVRFVSTVINKIKGHVEAMSAEQNSPVLMGLLLFSSRLLAFRTSLGLCNRLPYLTCCAHLVNAMRISNNLEKHWIDIAEAEKVLGSKAFWIGAEAPTEMGRASDNFMVRGGMSMSAVGSRRDRPATESSQYSRAGARLFENVARVQDKVYEIMNKDRRSPFLPDGLEQVIQLTECSPNDLMDGETLRLIAKLEDRRRKGEARQDVPAGESTMQGQGSGSRSDFRPRTCPERVIERLLQALQYEEKITSFPLFRLHEECHSALHAIAASCELEMVNHDPILHDTGDNFTVLTDLILKKAAGLTGKPPNTRLLALAAKAVKQKIQAGSTTAAFKAMKLLETGGKVEIVDYDLKTNEGKKIQEHSLMEGSVEHLHGGKKIVIVIKDGKWYGARKQGDGNGS